MTHPHLRTLELSLGPPFSWNDKRGTTPCNVLSFTHCQETYTFGRSSTLVGVPVVGEPLPRSATAELVHDALRVAVWECLEVTAPRAFTHILC